MQTLVAWRAYRPAQPWAQARGASCLARSANPLTKRRQTRAWRLGSGRYGEARSPNEAPRARRRLMAKPNVRQSKCDNPPTEVGARRGYRAWQRSWRLTASARRKDNGENVPNSDVANPFGGGSEDWNPLAGVAAGSCGTE